MSLYVGRAGQQVQLLYCRLCNKNLGRRKSMFYILLWSVIFCAVTTHSFTVAVCSVALQHMLLEKLICYLRCQSNVATKIELLCTPVSEKDVVQLQYSLIVKVGICAVRQVETPGLRNSKQCYSINLTSHFCSVHKSTPTFLDT